MEWGKAMNTNDPTVNDARPSSPDSFAAAPEVTAAISAAGQHPDRQHAGEDPATEPRRISHLALALVHTLWNTITVLCVHVVAIGILEKTPLLALLSLH
jgi:hypothetical protein